MKWRNRGHEFDDLGAVFQTHRQIHIYAVERVARDAAAKFALLGECPCFIRPLPARGAGLEKIRSLINRLTTHERRSLKSVCREPEGKIVLLPRCYAGEKAVLDPLLKSGFAFNRTVFWLEDFLRTYLPVYALYVKNIVYFPDISFIPSTKCNLNCKCCLNFTPFLKTMRDEPIERLKSEIDLFFSRIDCIGMFHVSGGEPFLYPHIEELLSYVGERYRDRIHELAVTTNGTREISDGLCTVLKKYSICVICDDYTRTLRKYKGEFKKLLECLRRHHVCFRINRVRWWIDLAPESTDNSKMTDDELVSFCDACAVPWAEYHSGKLYSCNYAHYAEKADLVPQGTTEYIDFSTLDDTQKKELVEFRAGYTKKGFMEFCKKCAGFGNNPYRRIPAEQGVRRR